MNQTVAKEPSGLIQRSDGELGFNLTKLIFLLVSIFAGCRAFSWLAGFYLARSLRSSPNSAVGLVASLAYPATAIFILFEMIVVIWLYRPVANLFAVSQRPAEGSVWIREVLVGAGAGLLVFLLAIPFLKDLNTRVFVNTIIPTIHPIEIRSVVYAVLLGIALPALGEVVFRGIVLRTLQSYASPFAAILVSTLLFAYIWPLFGIVVSILLSAMASVLYTWRKSLVSPIFANIVMTLSGGIYVVWRIWS
jgi:membrane protease YdiL (CAAX protease family)